MYTLYRVHFSALSAQDWAAISDIVSGAGAFLLALGTVIAALRAVYIYKKSKRAEAARWLQSMFEQFYLSDHFLIARDLMQYEYTETVGPLIERRLTNRDVPRTEEETKIINEIDRFLNYFEWVLYLEHHEHLDTGDKLALFQYWFKLMGDDDRAGIRRYCANWDWERLAEELEAQKGEYIAVYGSLMSGLELADAPKLSDYLEHMGPCKIRGKLFDLEDYPGLMPGDGIVKGELYRLKYPLSDKRSVEAFRLLDKYEKYDPHDAINSLYLRRAVRLQQPVNCDAWVYFYNKSVTGRNVIEGGNWREYKSSST